MNMPDTIVGQVAMAAVAATVFYAACNWFALARVFLRGVVQGIRRTPPPPPK